MIEYVPHIILGMIYLGAGHLTAKFIHDDEPEEHGDLYLGRVVITLFWFFIMIASIWQYFQKKRKS